MERNSKVAIGRHNALLINNLLGIQNELPEEGCQVQIIGFKKFKWIFTMPRKTIERLFQINGSHSAIGFDIVDIFCVETCRSPFGVYHIDSHILSAVHTFLEYCIKKVIQFLLYKIC